MVDIERLNGIVKNSGLMKKYIAEQIGLTPYGFALKLSGQNDFKAGEVQKLCQVLQINNPTELCSIFFKSEPD